MMILTGLFAEALGKVIEKIAEKGFEAAWEPTDKALKDRFLRWAGKDKAAERQAALRKATQKAREVTLRDAKDRQQVQKVLDALEGKLDKRTAPAFFEEIAKLALFSDKPDLPRLNELCQNTLRWRSGLAGEAPPSAEMVSAVLVSFVQNLHDALLDQEPYHDLMTDKKTLALLGQIAEGVKALKPSESFADEATYRAQVAEMNRHLDFIGIPELKERRPITVEEIFIRLHAERQAEPESERELLEAYRRAEEEGDQQTLARLREARDRLAHGPTPKARVAVEEALRETRRLVILGDPGSGKTTLLKYLAVICAEGRGEADLRLQAEGGGPTLPIFIPLREFAAECAQRAQDYCLLDYLYTYAREHLMLRLAPHFFEDGLEAGRCLVCLDGLDEVWAVGQRKKVSDAVKALATLYKRSRYIVTSRIVGYEEAPLDRGDFIHHTVLPLEDDDIREFVRKWYALREFDPVERKKKTDDLIATLDREPRIKDLGRNPLLLTIIALVHRIEAQLPHERVKLYDKCVTALVDTWEEVKGLIVTEEEKQRAFYRYRRRLLERLAYELHVHTAQPGKLQTVKEGDLELLKTRILMENRR